MVNLKLTHLHTHSSKCQSGLIPCFIYYLDLKTHDLALEGWYSPCTITFCVCVCVMAKPCNTVSMWPPVFRLVKIINLSLYSNTFDPHIHPFTFSLQAWPPGTHSTNNRETLIVKLTCKYMLRLVRWFSQDPSVVVSYYIYQFTLSLNLATPLLLTSELRDGVSLRGILMSLSRLPAWLSTSIFVSLFLMHMLISVSVTLLFSLPQSHIQDSPHLSLGILYSHKHHLSGYHFSPTTLHIPSALSSPPSIRYIPISDPDTHKHTHLRHFGAYQIT